MAQTYTKTLYQITIKTNDGATFTVADSIDCADASYALASLQKGSPARVFVGEDEYMVFPAGISHIKIETSQSEEIPVTNPC